MNQDRRRLRGRRVQPASPRCSAKGTCAAWRQLRVGRWDKGSRVDKHIALNFKVERRRILTCRAEKDYSRIPVGEGVESTRAVHCSGNFEFTHRVLAMCISLVAIFSAIIPRMYPDRPSDDAARVCCRRQNQDRQP